LPVAIGGENAEWRSSRILGSGGRGPGACHGAFTQPDVSRAAGAHVLLTLAVGFADEARLPAHAATRRERLGAWRVELGTAAPTRGRERGAIRAGGVINALGRTAIVGRAGSSTAPRAATRSRASSAARTAPRTGATPASGPDGLAATGREDDCSRDDEECDSHPVIVALQGRAGVGLFRA
jgi:hypothetical protein